MNEIDDNPDSSTSIAIIGMSGRFPKAGDCDALWKNLCEERDCISFFTKEELERNGFDTSNLGEDFVAGRPTMDDPDLFDASFFGYTPKEAAVMDPQQRILLETSWKAMEKAGYDSQRVPGPVGVFVGCNPNNYYTNNLLSQPELLDQFGRFPAWLLNGNDFLSTRISYKLNLKGPSITVQTACSTSLVAVAQACQSLLAYECDLALAGTVAINVPLKQAYRHQEDGILSVDGHCRPFDANATGTNFGDGVGAVVLRRLEDAEADGDTILAVIKGFAVNNDGADKAGYTAPSIDGQAEAIEMAHAFADINPRSVSYIEAHGTATPIGDPIEIAALTQAFRKGTQDSGFCAIGSIKSNIGHLDTAAGIAGLIKTVLALRNRKIPATIHYESPNPAIHFTDTPFYVADKLSDWEAGDSPRRAGVSSFGIGGTNAHIVLEEYISIESSDMGGSNRWNSLVFSARTEEALNESLAQFADFIEAQPNIHLASAAHTLQVGRRSFSHRASLACRDASEAVRILRGEDPDCELTRSKTNRQPRVVFMFPGQGSQKANMGRELYESYPSYRSIIDECSEKLIDEIGLDLREVLFPPPDRKAEAEALITQTRITQPALFVTEYALAKLWMERGIKPDAMIGHSIGEYVAACLAGVFSLDQGLKLVAMRARLIQEQASGAMLVIRKPEAEITPLLVNGVSISVLNGPSLSVVSGSHEAINLFQAKLETLEISTQRLHTSHAFHSPMMEAAAEQFEAYLNSLDLRKPQIPYVSNVTGDWISAEDAIKPSYWADHIRKPVRYSQGIKALLDTGDSVFLEVGPGITLSSLAKQQRVRNRNNAIISSLPAVNESHSERGALQTAFGRIWETGLDIAWPVSDNGPSPKRIPLPTYPFERKRYWVEPGRNASLASSAPTIGITPAQAPSENLRDSSSEANVSTAQARLLAMLHQLSGIGEHEMPLDATFFELGFDSLSLAQVSRAIKENFLISVSVRQLIEKYRTIGSLAAKIERAAPKQSPSEDPLQAIERLDREIDRLTRERDGIARKSNLPQLLEHDSPPPDEDRMLPLTSAQQEIWLACQLGDDVSRTYNESHLLHLDGPLNIQTLEECLNEILKRHDALRASFSNDGQWQRIARSAKLPLLQSDLSEDGKPEELAQLAQEEQTLLFELDKGPLLRARLFRKSPDKHALQLVIHHLVADGWSWSLILKELGELYSAMIKGLELPQNDSMQYADYIKWSESEDSLKHSTAAEAYWLDRLQDNPAEIELPADRQRPAHKTYHCGQYEHRFGGDTVKRLDAFCKEQQCTLFQLLMGSFNVWLYRLTGQSDLIVGVPMAGHMDSRLREMDRSNQLVGHSVNLLPIRHHCSGEITFKAFLEQVKTTILAAQDHQSASYGKLIEKLGRERDPSRIALISASLNLVGFDEVSMETLQVRSEAPAKTYNYFDLTIDLRKTPQDLIADCKFNSALFDEATVKTWIQQWQRVLEACIENCDIEVKRTSLNSREDQRRLIHDWNDTACSFSTDACLHSLIDRQARQTPDAIAVVFGESQLSYADLNARANQLAHRLIELGADRDTLVGICLDRSLDMLVGLLGILKSGAAYVPLDPAYPSDRIAYVLEDANADLLVTEQSQTHRLGTVSAQFVCLDRDRSVIDEYSQETPSANASPESLAYVIYTSGSTGKPKGVQIEHRAIVNFLESMAKQPGLDCHDTFLAVTTLSFDIAGLELYLPLIKGAKIALASQETASDGYALVNAVEKYGVTLMQATPITWRMMLEAGWQGTPELKILCGGEAFPQDLAEKLLPRCRELWNMYGPTETTVWSTCCRLTDATDIHIGHPIDNTDVYIVDRNFQTVPIGMPGQLIIGGAGLARGYHNKPNLTETFFIEHPFKAGEIAYCTGDEARYRLDGSIECLGRIDNQVKIRGFRIELGEIELNLSQHAQVRESVVIAREDTPGEKRLVAYLLSDSNLEPTADELRTYLRQDLPDYMIPSAFAVLDKFPLTPNGKIDRKALPNPQAEPSLRSRNSEAPQGGTETELAAIMSEVLRVKNIQRNDNFFDLGGHSLAAVTLFRKIEERFGKRLGLATLFEAPTVKDLASLIEEGEVTPKPHSSSLVPIQTQGERRPFYCVHGAGGNVLFYRDLSRHLGSDIPFYGLQSQGIDGNAPPLESIEEMARKYVEEVRVHQAKGPYQLGGYCLGGTIAYEMAQILRSQGEEVSLLALLDTYNFSLIESINPISMLTQRSAFHLSNLIRVPLPDWPSYLSAKLRVARDGEFSLIMGSLFASLKRERQAAQPEPAERAIQVINQLAAGRYTPRAYDGPLTLFKPQKNYAFYPDDLMGWRELVSGKIERVTLPMNPHAMLAVPFVKELAQRLRERLA